MSNTFIVNGVDVLAEIERLKAENIRLKKEVSDLNFYIDNYKLTWEIVECEQYKQALEEVKRLLTIAMDKETVSYLHFELIEKSIKEINEVLKDEIHN